MKVPYFSYIVEQLILFLNEGNTSKEQQGVKVTSINCQKLYYDRLLKMSKTTVNMKILGLMASSSVYNLIYTTKTANTQHK